MSVWFAIPSKKPRAQAQRCIDKWRVQGYRVAIWRDTGDEAIDCDLLLIGEYTGYANAVNSLCKGILETHPATAWVVTGGDDTEPDTTKLADQIGDECTAHFGGTFGMMQPTGDRWGDALGPYIDRVAGSPWMGAEYCRRMYAGDGALFRGYWHMHVDEEAQAVAQMLGVFWQRRDLSHLHWHWTREGVAEPQYLSRANRGFSKSARLFKRRKAMRFPGHEPLGWVPQLTRARTHTQTG